MKRGAVLDRLQGKTAMITGATKGIGCAAAELFVKEGANVVICGRSEEEGQNIVDRLEKDYPGKSIFCRLDVTKEADWENCIDLVKKNFGKLHILINNAGMCFRESVAETTMESWQTTLDTNQTGVFLGMKYAISAMKEHGESSSIVSTASVDGIVGDSVFFSYCATKAAVEAMTKCAALYCGENGLSIRVNAVAPGYVLTPMAYEDAKQNRQTIEEYSADSIILHPIGRLGTPLDIAYAYLYLASDEASFVTGTTLAVDGGYTCR
jgi:NAD(P)-dependent dehydrogenase (short-subunit alcohol dehydrogenase family)